VLWFVLYTDWQFCHVSLVKWRRQGPASCSCKPSNLYISFCNCHRNLCLLYQWKQAQYSSGPIHQCKQAQYSSGPIHQCRQAQYSSGPIHQCKQAQYSSGPIYQCKQAQYSSGPIYQCKQAQYSSGPIHQCKQAQYSSGPKRKMWRLAIPVMRYDCFPLGVLFFLKRRKICYISWRRVLNIGLCL